MTIQTTQSRITYAGDNVSTTFNIPFEFFLNSDLTVIKQVTSTGVQTTLVLGTDYNLSGAGTPSGGVLTKLTGALLSGEVLAIFLNPPITQQLHYVSNNPFPSSTTEQSLDRLTQISQRLSDRIGLALTAPDGDAVAPTSMPAAIIRANQYLVFDSSGNPSVSTGTGTDAGLRADLANSNTAGKGNDLVSNRRSAAEIAGSVTPTNLFIRSNDTEGDNNDLRYAPDLTGAVDTSGIWAKVNAVGVATKVVPGTYLFQNDTTINPPLNFIPGAVFKPGPGITITLAATFTAPPVQIFDLSLGGFVILPRDCGEVRPEWWGAKGDLVKINNEVPFNQAIWSLYQTVGGTFGGYLVCGRGDFYFTDTVYWPNNTSVRGHGQFYTALFANAAFNASSPYMHQCQAQTALQFTTVLAAAATSGTLTAAFTGTTGSYTVNFMTYTGVIEQHTATLTNSSTAVTWTGGLSANCIKFAMALTTASMFNNRFERLRIACQDIVSITAAIYAPAWQQKCGTDNVYIQGAVTYGIFADNGYGGAAQLTIKRTEIVLSQKASGASGIFFDMSTFVVGWLNVSLQEVQVSSNLATVTFTGAFAGGETSGTLTGNWALQSGSWNVKFSNGDYRLVTLTNGAATATWTGGLSAAATANATGVNPFTTGINGKGRVKYTGDNVHFESVASGFLLQSDACLYTSGVQASGNNTVQQVVQMAGSWTGAGNLRCRGMMKGGATQMFKDNSRSFALASAYGTGILGPVGGGTYNGDIIWPPDPSIPVASCKTAGGAVDAPPTFQTGSFFSGNIQHTATGTYAFTMAVNMDGISKYRVDGSSEQAQTQVGYTDATHFTIFTRNSAGALTDVGSISVDVFHSRS